VDGGYGLMRGIARRPAGNATGVPGTGPIMTARRDMRRVIVMIVSVVAPPAVVGGMTRPAAHRWVQYTRIAQPMSNRLRPPAHRFGQVAGHWPVRTARA
jgi:hypothetical protein